METKLCRICGKFTDNYVNIFKTEGLKNKIETCLPVVVSQHTLLPDTICSECSENVNNFYSFIKNCLQNIIILEAQYDIHDSCLKTKRKLEKGTSTTIQVSKNDVIVQTEEDFSDIFFFKEKSLSFSKKIAEVERILTNNDINFSKFETEDSVSKKGKAALVDYEIESDNDTDGENSSSSKGKVVLNLSSENESKFYSNDFLPYSLPQSFCSDKYKNVTNDSHCLNVFESKKFFDDVENNLISEITQRKSLKRKSEVILPHKSKMFKLDTLNKRKPRFPKRIKLKNDDKDIKCNSLPQICLLCNEQFSGPSALAAHVYETHGIDMAKIFSNDHILGNSYSYSDLGEDNEEVMSSLNGVQVDKILRPDFYKNNIHLDAHNDICKCSNQSDIHKCDVQPDSKFNALTEYSCNIQSEHKFNSPSNAYKCNLQHQSDIYENNKQTNFKCNICSFIVTNKTDLFSHLRFKHPKQAALICGLCFQPSPTYTQMKIHLEACSKLNPTQGSYICKICLYSEENLKNVENHILIHDFILSFCKKQFKMFDPSDYVDINLEGTPKTFTCSLCEQEVFITFKDFSAHRRNVHQIFHCDLCSKFYGRNSHLWKHVNRLHKGHPSITCQLCSKTSASKYHLQQHFNKIHSVRAPKQSGVINNEEVNFLNKKFQGFDFQSVKQSFLRQELLSQKQEKNNSSGSSSKDEVEDNSNSNEISYGMKCMEEIAGHKEESSDSKVQDKNNYQDELNGDDLPKAIDSSSNLYNHIITNYTPPKNDGEYKCPKCYKGFHKKNLLRKHKINCKPKMQKDLLTRCKTCSRIFKDRQSLTKHLINYHSEYECEICSKKFQSKCEIVSHIRFSHPNCHLFCHCGNILRSKADLLEHKKDHRNSNVCQFCGDALPTKIKLKMHILSLHRKILSLSCGICLKLFETQHILRDHVRMVHANQLKPLNSCCVCGKNYGSKWKTFDHINKSHGRSFKACKTCLEVFDTELELQAHFEVAHGNQSNKNLNSNSKNSNDTDAKKDVDQKEVLESDFEEEKNSASDTSNEEDLGNTENCTDLNFYSKINSELLQKKNKQPSENEFVEYEQKFFEENDFEQFNAPSSKRREKKNKKSKNSKIKREVEENPSHNTSKRTVYVNSNDPSLCEICLRTWPAKKHLWQHYIRCHKTEAATVCGICLKTNDNYLSLQKHLNENHPTLLHGQGFGSNFICRICGRYHNASSKLKLHMAIHENFDWGILQSDDSNNENKYKKEDQFNECVEDQSEVLNDDINYESLIEQVECSTDESDNESVVRNVNFNNTTIEIEENASSTEESENSSLSEDEDEENRDEISENKMNDFENGVMSNSVNEKKLLKSYSNEKVITTYGSEDNLMNNYVNENNINDYEVEVHIKEEIKVEDLSSEEDEAGEFSNTEVSCSEDESAPVKGVNVYSEEEMSPVSAVTLMNEQLSSTNTNDSNTFVCKAEELDSAIRSISYEQVEVVEADLNSEYYEIPVQNLNQHEIQSAVDSIL